MNTFDILDRPIAFHRVFVTITGSITAALMLSQAIYWTRRTGDNEGWFWKTQEDWEKETGLTRHEQELARNRLLKTTFWKEARRGAPAKLYYFVDERALENELKGYRKELTLDDVIEMDSPRLTRLSKVGHMRALKLDVQAEYVNYIEVLVDCGMVCGICGNPITKGLGQKEGELCFDHVIPLASGGSHTKENIKPAHAECNSRKGKSTDYKPKVQNVYSKQTRMSTVDKLECLHKADKNVYGKQTRMSTVGNQSLYTEITSKTTSEITSSSFPQAPTIQTDDDDDDDVLIDSNPHFDLCLKISAKMTDWAGPEKFLRGLNERQLIAAASWLYLWHLESFDVGEMRHYTKSPFDGVANPVGKIVEQSRRENVAPLAESHKRQLSEILRGNAELAEQGEDFDAGEMARRKKYIPAEFEDIILR